MRPGRPSGIPRDPPASVPRRCVPVRARSGSCSRSRALALLQAGLRRRPRGPTSRTAARHSRPPVVRRRRADRRPAPAPRLAARRAASAGRRCRAAGARADAAGAPVPARRAPPPSRRRRRRRRSPGAGRPGAAPMPWRRRAQPRAPAQAPPVPPPPPQSGRPATRPIPSSRSPRRAALPPRRSCPARSARVIVRIEFEGNALFATREPQGAHGAQGGRASRPRTRSTATWRLLFRFFERCGSTEEPSPGGIVLRFLVSENPLVVQLNIYGVEEFEDAEIREMLRTQGGLPALPLRPGHRCARTSSRPTACAGYHFAQVPEPGHHDAARRRPARRLHRRRGSRGRGRAGSSSAATRTSAAPTCSR